MLSFDEVEHARQKATEIVFARTCQECGNRQLDKEPKQVTDAYLFRKCAKCKSEALDYGSRSFIIEHGKIVDAPIPDEE